MARWVDIPLDKPRRLKYTINAVRELERHFGRSFGKIFEADNLGFEQLIILLTIGLKYGETGKRVLTDTQVGDLVQKTWMDNDKSFADLTQYILDAMKASGIIGKGALEEEIEDTGQDVGGTNLPND